MYSHPTHPPLIVGHPILLQMRESSGSTPDKKQHCLKLSQLTDHEIFTLTVESQDPVTRTFSLQDKQVTEESCEYVEFTTDANSTLYV